MLMRSCIAHNPRFTVAAQFIALLAARLLLQVRAINRAATECVVDE